MNRPAADENGRNYFHAIAAAGQLKLATRTLASTPRKTVLGGLTAKDKRGRTPLHHAAYAGHLRVLRVFAEAAPDAMLVRDQDGNAVREALRRPDASVLGDPADTRYFQRLLCIDKLGYTVPNFPFGPADVWDVAVSSTSTAAIVRPTWDAALTAANERVLFVSQRETMVPVDLGPGNVPRFVANSNLHTLVLTDTQCFAWGKNANGILGLDNDGKTVHTPEALDAQLVEHSRALERNLFSALGGTQKGDIKDPLVGVACCDFHSACCSTTKVWAWGANRGQMRGKVLKNTVVDTPMVVYEAAGRIRSISSADNALVVLHSNGNVVILHNDQSTRLVLCKGNADAEAVAARGNYVAVQTSNGKLLRYALSNIDDPVTIWISRRPKDAILSFDLSDNGAAIVATKAGVYKIEDGRDVTELRDVKGMDFTMLKADSHMRSFVGVQRVIAGLGFSQGSAPRRQKYPSARTCVEWRDRTRTDMHFKVGAHKVAAHKAVVYARCPTLGPLVTNGVTNDARKGSDPALVAVPGGSAIFKSTSDSTISVSHAPLKSVEAFVESLYAPRATSSDVIAGFGLEAGPELHEFLALARLITRDIGEGLWQSRLGHLGTDLVVQGTHAVHSQVLAAASPVLAVQLGRWGEDAVLSDVPDQVLDPLLKYIYTLELDGVTDGDLPANTKADQAQCLFELWELADELLMSCLSSACEQRLFEMIDFDLVAPLLSATSGPEGTPASRLRCALLDVVARHMNFFWNTYTEFDPETMDALELVVTGLEGSEVPDPELAGAVDALKALSQSSATPQSSKKKKPATPLSPSASPSSSPSAPAGKYTPPSTSSSSSSTTTATVASSLAGSAPAASSSNAGGWIQARRKSRTSSQATHEKSGALRGLLGTPSHNAQASPALPVLGSSPSSSSLLSSPSPPASASSPSPYAWASPPSSSTTLAPSRRPSPSLPGLSRSPKAATPQPARAPDPTKPPARLQAQAQAAAPTPSSAPAPPKLADLPQLPALGSVPQPRAGSSGRGTRPKFSQKDKKNLQQFQDPLALAQQLEKREAAAGHAQTPWKQVGAASSQSVLERLERVHQINKRPSRGSVWGV